MKEYFSKILFFLRHRSIFDWLVVLVVLAGLTFLALFIFKEEKWVKTEVKLTQSPWDSESKNPYWLIDQIKKGEIQYDSLGRKVAEVLEVKTYNWSGATKMAYLTLNLKVEVDQRTRKYKFVHKPLEIGKLIDLSFGQIGIQGLVTFIDGVSDDRKIDEKIVELRLFPETALRSIFPETLGIMPWVPDAIKVGDKMKDNQGKSVGEILAKTVKPAEKVVVTADGRVLSQKDPIKKDVILTAKLNTVSQGGSNYYLDEFEVKVGNYLLLSLPEINLWPQITKIIK